MRIGPGRQAPDLGELRRLAARRRAVGDRMRRLLPGVIVGSTTLVGTGALAAWVSGQPGVNTPGAGSPSRPSVTTAVTATTTDPVHSLQQALQADEASLHSLEAAMPEVPAPAANASGSGSAPVATGTAAGATVTPTVAPLPKIVIPALPQVVASPAPAVNATTGASHAIP